MGWDPLWAWVYAVLDPQDSIKELMNCVLKELGKTNGHLMWTAAYSRRYPKVTSQLLGIGKSTNISHPTAHCYCSRLVLPQ